MLGQTATYGVALTSHIQVLRLLSSKQARRPRTRRFPATTAFRLHVVFALTSGPLTPLQHQDSGASSRGKPPRSRLDLVVFLCHPSALRPILNPSQSPPASARIRPSTQPCRATKPCKCHRRAGRPRAKRLSRLRIRFMTQRYGDRHQQELHSSKAMVATSHRAISCRADSPRWQLVHATSSRLVSVTTSTQQNKLHQLAGLLARKVNTGCYSITR